jgi:hypothetical protein
VQRIAIRGSAFYETAFRAIQGAEDAAARFDQADT